jgi:hypothetical protein
MVINKYNGVLKLILELYITLREREREKANSKKENNGGGGVNSTTLSTTINRRKQTAMNIESNHNHKGTECYETDTLNKHTNINMHATYQSQKIKS